MSVPAFECPAEWTNECGCPDSHNYCWPEPIVTCCDELQVTPTTPPEQLALIEMSKRLAVELLHSFSGQQFGLCRRIVRPCRDECVQPVGAVWSNGQLQPTLVGGVWFNEACGSCRSGCSCTEVCEVTFPGRIERIIEIRIDGTVVDPLDYRVDNYRKLVAQGAFCWPTCQDMTAPAGEPGTWTVEYLVGTPVPEGGRWAAGLLACEFVKACSPGGGGTCELPDGVQRIVREGITLEVVDDIASEFDWGKTGISRVDRWLSSVNPHKITRRAMAFSPDRPAMRRTTWPCP